MQKKIALLGAAGVGKTSLVRRFVASLFDDKYLTTIGVKVDKKVVAVGSTDVTLMIWDIAGAEEHFTVPTSYVKGAAGYLVVVDGTRPETLHDAARLKTQVARDLGPIPFVLVVNKRDLVDQWRVEADALAALAEGAVTTFETSAKSGEGVDDAFARLAAALA